MKIIFAGTPAFAVPVLKALVQDGHEILAVYTQPDRPTGRGRLPAASPVKQFAVELALPVKQPKSLYNEAVDINRTGCDLIVVVAYGLILPREVLDAPRLGCINVHASILPRWRGAAPIQRALEAGDQETGISIMQMEVGLDTGPVYSVAVTRIDDTDTAQSLHDRLAKLGAKTLVEVVRALEAGMATPVEQDDADACYASKLNKAEAEIDWFGSAANLQRRIRAFNPWPVCQTSHQGQRLRVWSAQVHEQDSLGAIPGTVTTIKDGVIVVRCGDGCLGITRLQRDGAKPLLVDEFLRGYTISVGDTLGQLPTEPGKSTRGSTTKK